MEKAKSIRAALCATLKSRPPQSPQLLAGPPPKCPMEGSHEKVVHAPYQPWTLSPSFTPNLCALAISDFMKVIVTPLKTIILNIYVSASLSSAQQIAVQSKTVWIVYVLRPMPLVALYLRGITENMGGLNASTRVLMPTILPTTTVCGHSMRVPHLNLVCCQN